MPNRLRATLAVMLIGVGFALAGCPEDPAGPGQQPPPGEPPPPQQEPQQPPPQQDDPGF